MRLVRALVAMGAVGLLAGSVVASAQAQWTVTLGSTPAEVEVERMGSANFKLTGLFGGVKAEFTATGIECATSTSNCQIDENVAENHSVDTFKLTGVSVMAPSNCSVTGGTLTTNKLTDFVEMVTVAGSSGTFDKIFPETGSTLVSIPVEGPLCVLDGSTVPVNGFVFAEMQATGISSERQPLVFNTRSNSISGLRYGPTNAAALEGEATFSLRGGNVGKWFEVSG